MAILASAILAFNPSAVCRSSDGGGGIAGLQSKDCHFPESASLFSVNSSNQSACYRALGDLLTIRYLIWGRYS